MALQDLKAKFTLTDNVSDVLEKIETQISRIQGKIGDLVSSASSAGPKLSGSRGGGASADDESRVDRLTKKIQLLTEATNQTTQQLNYASEAGRLFTASMRELSVAPGPDREEIAKYNKELLRAQETLENFKGSLRFEANTASLERQLAAITEASSLAEAQIKRQVAAGAARGGEFVSDAQVREQERLSGAIQQRMESLRLEDAERKKIARDIEQENAALQEQIRIREISNRLLQEGLAAGKPITGAQATSRAREEIRQTPTITGGADAELESINSINIAMEKYLREQSESAIAEEKKAKIIETETQKIKDQIRLREIEIELAQKNASLPVGSRLTGPGITSAARQQFGLEQTIANAGKLGVDPAILRDLQEKTDHAAVKIKEFAEGGKQASTYIDKIVNGLTRIATFSIGASLVVNTFNRLQQGLGYLETVGFKFNASMENAQLAIASSLSIVKQLGDSQGHIADSASTYPLFLERARDIQKELLRLNIETLGTGEELNGVFGQVLTFSKGQVASDRELLQLSQNITNAGKLRGLSGEKLTTEARQLLTLERYNGQTILQSLGVTLQQAKAWKEQGILVQELNKRLQVYTAMSKDAALTWEGLTTTVQTYVEAFAGLKFENIFGGVKGILQGFGEEMRHLQETGKSIVINLDVDQLKNVGKIAADFVATLIDGLARITAAGIEFANSMRPIGQILSGAIEIVGTFFGGFVTGASQAIERVSSLIDKLKEAGGLEDKRAASHAGGVFSRAVGTIGEFAGAGAAAGAAFGAPTGIGIIPGLLAGAATGTVLGTIKASVDEVTRAFKGLDAVEFGNFRGQVANLAEAAGELIAAGAPKNANQLNALALNFKEVEKAMVAVDKAARGQLDTDKYEKLKEIIDKLKDSLRVAEDKLVLKSDFVKYQEGLAELPNVVGDLQEKSADAKKELETINGLISKKVDPINIQAEIQAQKDLQQYLKQNKEFIGKFPKGEATIPVGGFKFTPTPEGGFGEVSPTPQNRGDIENLLKQNFLERDKFVKEGTKSLRDYTKAAEDAKKGLERADAALEQLNADLETANAKTEEQTQKLTGGGNFIQQAIDEAQGEVDKIKANLEKRKVTITPQIEIALQKLDTAKAQGKIIEAMRTVSDEVQKADKKALEASQHRLDVTEAQVRIEEILSNQRRANAQVELDILRTTDSNLPRQLELIKQIGEEEIKQIQINQRLAQAEIVHTQEAITLKQAELDKIKETLETGRDALIAQGKSPQEAQGIFDSATQQSTEASNAIDMLKAKIAELQAKIAAANDEIANTGKRTADQLRHAAGAIVDIQGPVQSALEKTFEGLGSGKLSFKSIGRDLFSDLNRSWARAIAEMLRKKLGFDNIVIDNFNGLGNTFATSIQTGADSAFSYLKDFASKVGDLFSGLFSGAGGGLGGFFSGLGSIFSGGGGVAGGGGFFSSLGSIFSSGGAGGGGGSGGGFLGFLGNLFSGGGSVLSNNPNTPNVPLQFLPPELQIPNYPGFPGIPGGSTAGVTGAGNALGTATSAAGAIPGIGQVVQIVGLEAQIFGGLAKMFGGGKEAVLGTQIGTFLLGPLGGLLGGLIGGLFAPGRIAQEKTDIVKALEKDLPGFNLNVVKESQGAAGIAKYGRPVDPAALALGSVYTQQAGGNIGTVKRFDSQLLGNFDRLGLSAKATQQEILKLAKTMGFDLDTGLTSITANISKGIFSLNTFQKNLGDARKNLRQYGDTSNLTAEELSKLAVSHGNVGSKIVTLNDVLAGTIGIVTEFDPLIDAQAISNGAWATSLENVAKGNDLVTSAVTDVIGKVRDGSLSIEEAVIQYNKLAQAAGKATIGLNDLELDPAKIQAAIDSIKKAVEDLRSTTKDAIISGIKDTEGKVDVSQSIRTGIYNSILDSVVTGFTDGFIKSSLAVGPISKALQKIGDLTDQLLAKEITPQEYIDKTKQIFQDLAPVVKTVAQALGESTKYLKEALASSGTLGDIIGNGAAGLGDVASSLQSVSASAIEEGIKQGTDSGKTAATIRTNFFGTIFHTVVDAFTKGIIQSAAISGPIAEWSKRFNQLTEDFVNGKISKVDFFAGIKDSLGHAVPFIQAISEGLGVASDELTKILSQVPGLMDALRGADSLGSGLADSLQKAASTNFVDGIINGLNSRDIAQAIRKGFYGDLLNAVADAFTQGIIKAALATGPLKAYFDKIQNLFSDFAGGKITKGELFAGIKEGLTGMVPLIQVIAEAVGDASVEFGKILKDSGTLADILSGADSEAKKLADDLRKSAQDLLTDPNLSPLKARERMVQDQTSFEQLRAKALAGDKDAASKLPEAAQKLLEEARNVFSSSPAYEKIFDFVRGTLLDVANIFGPIEDVGTQQLHTLQEIRDYLKSIDGVFRGQAEGTGRFTGILSGNYAPPEGTGAVSNTTSGAALAKNGPTAANGFGPSGISRTPVTGGATPGDPNTNYYPSLGNTVVVPPNQGGYGVSGQPLANSIQESANSQKTAAESMDRASRAMEDSTANAGTASQLVYQATQQAREFRTTTEALGNSFSDILDAFVNVGGQQVPYSTDPGSYHYLSPSQAASLAAYTYPGVTATHALAPIPKIPPITGGVIMGDPNAGYYPSGNNFTVSLPPVPGKTGGAGEIKSLGQGVTGEPLTYSTDPGSYHYLSPAQAAAATSFIYPGVKATDALAPIAKIPPITGGVIMGDPNAGYYPNGIPGATSNDPTSSLKSLGIGVNGEEITYSTDPRSPHYLSPAQVASLSAYIYRGVKSTNALAPIPKISPITGGVILGDPNSGYFPTAAGNLNTYGGAYGTPTGTNPSAYGFTSVAATTQAAASNTTASGALINFGTSVLGDPLTYSTDPNSPHYLSPAQIAALSAYVYPGVPATSALQPISKIAPITGGVIMGDPNAGYFPVSLAEGGIVRGREVPALLHGPEAVVPLPHVGAGLSISSPELVDEVRGLRRDVGHLASAMEERDNHSINGDVILDGEAVGRFVGERVQTGLARRQIRVPSNAITGINF